MQRDVTQIDSGASACTCATSRLSILVACVAAILGLGIGFGSADPAAQPVAGQTPFGNCTMLILHRETGKTTSVPCSAGMGDLREGQPTGRQDFVQRPSRRTAAMTGEAQEPLPADAPAGRETAP